MLGFVSNSMLLLNCELFLKSRTEKCSSAVTPYIRNFNLRLFTCEGYKDRKEYYGKNCVEEDNNPERKCRGDDTNIILIIQIGLSCK